MSALAVSPRPAHELEPVSGRRATLEERLESTWQELSQHAVASCPSCHGRMLFEAGEGHCRECGTRLS